MALYIDGKQVQEVATTGALTRPERTDLLIGRVREKMMPVPSGLIHPRHAIRYSLEGVLDELTIHGRALDAAEIAAAFAAIKVPSGMSSPWAVMPAGSPGAGRFGAYYETLLFQDTWDRPRRVGPASDVVVRFPQSGMRLVFWQGNNYIPAWVTENGKWYTDEFICGLLIARYCAACLGGVQWLLDPSAPVKVAGKSGISQARTRLGAEPQLRYNAVMREAAKIQGAAVAATGSAESQTAALGREVMELREAVGAQFQGLLKGVVRILRDLVGFLKENSDWIVKLAEGAIFLSGVLATYALATKITAITTAVEGLAAALAANPVAMLAAGVVAGGAIIYKTWQDTKAGPGGQAEEMRRRGLQQDLMSGKMTLADARKTGYSDEQLREIVAGRSMVAGESWGDYSGTGLKVNAGKPAPPEVDADRVARERRLRAEAEKSAQELYLRAIEERKTAEHDMARADRRLNEDHRGYRL